jgi:glycosyltransferase involved in cell wall biosynthesis
MDTLVSIIVPIYKVEEYLRQCLDSIVTQTYSNIEIILVDDGSPDNCGKICDEYAEKDSRINVIHKKNEGLSIARNVGIDIAKGDYLMFVDSDDWVEPTYCERALETAILQGVDCVAVGVNVINEGGPIIKFNTTRPGFFSTEETIGRLVDGRSPYNGVWNKIYKRSLFKTIRFPAGIIFEDQAVMYLLLHQSNGVYVISDKLYNYRRRPDSLSGDNYSPQMIRCRFEVWCQRLTFLESYYPGFYNRQLIRLAITLSRGLCLLKGDETTKRRIEEFLENKKGLIKTLSLDRTTSILLTLYYQGGLLRWLYFNVMPIVLRKREEMKNK